MGHRTCVANSTLSIHVKGMIKMNEEKRKYLYERMIKDGYIAWIQRTNGWMHIDDILRIVSVELQDDRKNDYVVVFSDHWVAGKGNVRRHGTRRVFYDKLGRPYIKAWDRRFHVNEWHSYDRARNFEWTRKEGEGVKTYEHSR